MLKRKLLLAALAVSSIALAPIPASAAVGIYVDVAPPAPRYEVVPAPRAGYVWAPGYYDWRNGRQGVRLAIAESGIVILDSNVTGRSPRANAPVAWSVGSAWRSWNARCWIRAMVVP